MIPNGTYSEPRGAWRDRRVLVTGAGGFAASWICKALVDAGADVVGIVRDTSGERQLDLYGILDRIALVRGSITDLATVERALNEYEIDFVFHLAAQSLVGAANRSPLSTFESNIRGTWTLLEACRVTRPESRIVVASSDKAYGDQVVLPYQEDASLDGSNPYDVSKVCTDAIARSYAVSYGLNVAVTRCANLYGGGDLNWSRLIPGTIRAVLRGEPPIIRSDGTLERDYLYIGDAVEAYLTLAGRASDPGVRGRAFNFGSGRPIRVLALVEQILAAADSPFRPQVLRRNAGEIGVQFLDSSRARAVLGWEPRVDLSTGLRLATNWYAEYLGAGVAPVSREAMAGGNVCRP